MMRDRLKFESVNGAEEGSSKGGKETETVEPQTTLQPGNKTSVQFSPVPSPTGSSGDMRTDSAEILLQTFLRDALVSSSGMGGYFHSLMFSVQHFLCRTRHRPPSQVP